MTAGQIIAGLERLGHHVTGIRIRAIMHYLRVSDTVPLLCSSSNPHAPGYWIGTPAEAAECAAGLDGRRHANCSAGPCGVW